MRMRNCLKMGVCLSVVLVLILAAQSFAAKGRSTSPAGNGTIEGTVTGMKGMSVVYLEAIPGKTFQAPEKHAFVDEKELGFIPHILVVLQGTTTDFLNSDKVQHNVSWPSVGGNKKLARNLGTLGTGERRSFKFDNPGLVELLCNCHQEMAGFILVSPTPYFAQTDASGNYSIKDVPDGSYTVTVWHENAKSKSQQVQVVAGNAKVDFEIERK